MRWNFAKFLVGRDGVPVKKYGEAFDAKRIARDVRALLEERAPRGRRRRICGAPLSAGCERTRRRPPRARDRCGGALNGGPLRVCGTRAPLEAKRPARAERERTPTGRDRTRRRVVALEDEGSKNRNLGMKKTWRCPITPGRRASRRPVERLARSIPSASPRGCQSSSLRRYPPRRGLLASKQAAAAARRASTVDRHLAESERLHLHAALALVLQLRDANTGRNPVALLSVAALVVARASRRRTSASDGAHARGRGDGGRRKSAPAPRETKSGRAPEGPLVRLERVLRGMPRASEHVARAIVAPAERSPLIRKTNPEDDERATR